MQKIMRSKNTKASEKWKMFKECLENEQGAGNNLDRLQTAGRIDTSADRRTDGRTDKRIVVVLRARD